MSNTNWQTKTSALSSRVTVYPTVIRRASGFGFQRKAGREQSVTGKIVPRSFNGKKSGIKEPDSSIKYPVSRIQLLV